MYQYEGGQDGKERTSRNDAVSRHIYRTIYEIACDCEPLYNNFRVLHILLLLLLYQQVRLHYV